MENRRILVVDDNEALHDDFKKILRSLKNSSEENLSVLEDELFEGETVNNKYRGPHIEYELEHAFQGEEGFEKAVQAQKEGKPFALVFMDIRMPPGWDGVKAVAKILEKIPNTQIVICTAYSDFSLAEINGSLGCADRLLLLKKPFEAAEIRQMTLSLTERWNQCHRTQRREDDSESGERHD